MKEATKVHEEKKMMSNPVYKEAVESFKETEKRALVAKMDQ